MAHAAYSLNVYHVTMAHAPYSLEYQMIFSIPSAFEHLINVPNTYSTSQFRSLLLLEPALRLMVFFRRRVAGFPKKGVDL